MSHDLSKFIKQKRKDLKLTQVELSEKAGVGIRFIRELEGGKSTLRIDKINQVLDLFGYELGPIVSDRNIIEDEKSESLHA
ncbi:MAG: helix-turn-helix transcriptional regulator [Bacteroidales bacterium]|nr:helix-turn-helix transcriptional regulator [Bacteroidales bacterium]